MLTHNICNALISQPRTSTIHWLKVEQFIRLIRLLKNELAYQDPAQPAGHLSFPIALTGVVCTFLTKALQLELEQINSLWIALGKMIWEDDMFHRELDSDGRARDLDINDIHRAQDIAIFKEYGYPLQLGTYSIFSILFLYSPTPDCLHRLPTTSSSDTSLYQRRLPKSCKPCVAQPTRKSEAVPGDAIHLRCGCCACVGDIA